VPVGDGKVEGVRTLKRLNQSTQNLARVLTSAVSIQIDRRAITGLGLTVSKSTVTDLRPVCTDVRTMAVDERSEVSFSIPPGTLPWQPILGGAGKIDVESTHLRN